MRAISAVVDHVARVIGLADAVPSAAAAPPTMLDELAALWQPMVAVPRAIAVTCDDREAPALRALGAGNAASAAWCVIDLDGGVLSCESRGLWWDPFEVVPAPASGDTQQGDGDDSDRILLRSADRSRGASWWCEIVRGPRVHGGERSIYYTNLTFSDSAVEPQRGVISGARLRAAPKPRPS